MENVIFNAVLLKINHVRTCCGQVRMKCLNIFTTLLFLVTRWEIKELTFISADQTSSQSFTSLLLWSVEFHSYTFIYIHSFLGVNVYMHPLNVIIMRF